MREPRYEKAIHVAQLLKILYGGEGMEARRPRRRFWEELKRRLTVIPGTQAGNAQEFMGTAWRLPLMFGVFS